MDNALGLCSQPGCYNKNWLMYAVVCLLPDVCVDIDGWFLALLMDASMLLFVLIGNLGL